MNTLYALTEGTYDDLRTVAVFEREVDARAAQAISVDRDADVVEIPYFPAGATPPKIIGWYEAYVYQSGLGPSPTVKAIDYYQYRRWSFEPMWPAEPAIGEAAAGPSWPGRILIRARAVSPAAAEELARAKAIEVYNAERKVQ